MKINPSPEAAASRAANVFAWKNETANELLRIQFLRTRKYFICKDDKGLVRLCKQKSGYIQSILKKNHKWRVHYAFRDISLKLAKIL